MTAYSDAYGGSDSIDELTIAVTTRERTFPYDGTQAGPQTQLTLEPAVARDHAQRPCSMGP